MLSDFEKEKVYWTRKMNLKLVKFMNSKPHIWNPKHPKYTSVKLRDHTYGQFAALYDYQFSGQAVKERWTNIRSTFASYLRKLNSAQRDAEDYKVNWHLWDACQFLLKVTKGVKHSQSTSEVEDFSANDDEGDNSTFGKADSQSNEEIPAATCKTIAEDLATVFKGLQNDVFGLDNTINGNIGQNVAKKLSEMDSNRSAKLAVIIMEVLLKHECDNVNASYR